MSHGFSPSVFYVGKNLSIKAIYGITYVLRPNLDFTKGDVSFSSVLHDTECKSNATLTSYQLQLLCSPKYTTNAISLLQE